MNDGTSSAGPPASRKLRRWRSGVIRPSKRRAHADGANVQKEKALVSDSVVRRCVLDAVAGGAPKIEVLKWVLDCNRNFYVTNDATFKQEWAQLWGRWKRNSARRQRRQAMRNVRSPKRSPSPSPPPPRAPSSPNSGLPLEAGAGSRPEVEQCREEAQHDVHIGVCASFEQALAVRLVLALGIGAAQALAEISPGPNMEMPSLRRLALLVHPDKTPHPLAKEAFQRLAPNLRDGN